MQITALAKEWFLLGLALVLVGFLSFVFTTNEPLAQNVRFLAVNESPQAATLTIFLSGEEVFSQQIGPAVEGSLYDGRQTAAFNLEATRQEFVLEARAHETGLTQRKLVNLSNGAHITVIHWGDELVINQSQEPF